MGTSRNSKTREKCFSNTKILNFWKYCIIKSDDYEGILEKKQEGQVQDQIKSAITSWNFTEMPQSIYVSPDN